jgi:hypothetical protein
MKTLIWLAISFLLAAKAADSTHYLRVLTNLDKHKTAKKDPNRPKEPKPKTAPKKGTRLARKLKCEFMRLLSSNVSSYCIILVQPCVLPLFSCRYAKLHETFRFRSLQIAKILVVQILLQYSGKFHFHKVIIVRIKHASKFILELTQSKTSLMWPGVRVFLGLGIFETPHH